VVRVARNTSTSHNEAIKKEKECKYPADQKEQKRSELMWRQIEWQPLPEKVKKKMEAPWN